MGVFQLTYTVVGAMVFVAAIIGGRFFIVSNFATADIEAQITTRELNAMTLSYDILDCLKQGGDSVDKSFLDQNRGKNLCDLCGICNIIAEAKVTDLEATPETEWKFDYSVTRTLTKDIKDKLAIWKGAERHHKTHSLYLDIDHGDDSHMGRLDVNV
jgi:hypothetical protein